MRPSSASITSATGNSAVASQKKLFWLSIVKRMNDSTAAAPRNPFASVKSVGEVQRPEHREVAGTAVVH